MQADASATLQGCECHGHQRPKCGHDPERQGWSLFSAHDSHDGRRCREERNDHGAVAGRRRGEGEVGTEGEADDDAARDDGEAKPLVTARKVLPGNDQGGRGKHCSDDSAAGSDEQRRHALDGHAGEGNGEGKRGDAEQPPGEASPRR